MKFTKIALAVAALAAAQNAAAFETYMSGASALRDFVPLMMDKICQPNSVTTPRAMYEAGPAISGSKSTVSGSSVANTDKDRRVFTCTLHTAATSAGVAADLGTTLVGQPITLYWSNEIGDSLNGSSGKLDNLLGGSITGVATVVPATNGASQATVNWVNPASGCIANGPVDGALGATLVGNDAVGAAVKGFGFIGASKFSCNSHKAGTTLTQIGISDVEPSKFDVAFQNVPTDLSAINGGPAVVPDGYMNYDLTALPKANVKTMFVGTFGVVVQDAVKTAGVTNLSHDQLAAILSGTITDWRQVGATSATAMPIKVCSRAPGSGTKATFNQLIARAGCKADTTIGFEYGVATADSISSSDVRYGLLTAAGAGVRENATTGQVQSCMTDAKDVSGATAAPAGLAAIGIIGLDGLAGVASSSNPGYSAVAIDGVNPTDLTQSVANNRILEGVIAQGQYPLWVESTAQKSAVTGAIAGADATKVNALYTYVSAHAGDAEYTTQFPGIITLDDGRAGAGGLAHTSTRGDMYYFRGGDTCQVPQYQ